MIGSFFKLFLLVRDLARSVPFYQGLGLELVAFRAKATRHVYTPLGEATVDPSWTRAVFWIDRARTQLLILAEPGERGWRRQHIAFDVALADLGRAHAWLAERGLAPLPDFGREPIEPIVHNWIPAASLLFEDPDGNQLELSARLPGAPIPDEHLPPAEQQPLYLSEWERLRKRLDRAQTRSSGTASSSASRSVKVTMSVPQRRHLGAVADRRADLAGAVGRA